MADFLQSVKDAVKQTPLWPILRPRRIHLYGIGAPRTGTLSLRRLFGYYRTGFEVHLDTTVDLIRSQLSDERLRNRLRRRDRRARFESEVAYYLVYLCQALALEFPQAKFICTVRPPRRWLRSIVNKCINSPREKLPKEYRFLRDYSFGQIPEHYPSEEAVLEKYSLHSLDGYLSYWAFHFQTVLDAIPSSRRLLLRTKSLSSASEQIADFVGIPESRLCGEQSHAHRTSEKHGVLDEIDEDYLGAKIETHCQEVADRLRQNSQISL